MKQRERSQCYKKTKETIRTRDVVKAITVDCRAEGEAVLYESPMAKPANHDPSASMVSPPDPVPDPAPDSVPEPVPAYSSPDPVPDPCDVVVPSVVGVEQLEDF